MDHLVTFQWQILVVFLSSNLSNSLLLKNQPCYSESIKIKVCEKMKNLKYIAHTFVNRNRIIITNNKTYYATLK